MQTTLKSMKAAIQSTWFWRVYGVCAMKRTWTKFLVACFIFNGYWTLFYGLDYVNPILKLEQMHKQDGELLSVYSPKRQARGSTLVIRKDSGEEISYRGTIYGEEAVLEAAIGQQITVWSQPVYEAWYPFFYERFRQVQQGEKILIDYKNGLGRKRYREDYASIYFNGALALSLLPFLIVTWVCRKGDCPQNGS